MSVASKKRRSARREAFRAGKGMEEAMVEVLRNQIMQDLKNSAPKEEKRNPILSMTDWLKVNHEKKEAKKEFRAHRAQHKLEMELAAEKEQRQKNRELRRIREEKRAARKAKEQA